MSLTRKKIAFCEQYVIDRDSAKAAVRAGYAPKHAQGMGYLLMKQQEVLDYIGELDEQIRERNKITKDTIIKDICEIRDRCMQRVPVMRFDNKIKDFVQVTDEDGEGVWQFDARNALQACDMLAKHIGFYEADKQPNTNINILNAPNIDDLKRIKRMLDEG